MSLQCAAEGIPKPAITWAKDGRPVAGQQRAEILNEGRLLQIRKVKVSDTGRYTCIAVNAAGQADSRQDISVHGGCDTFILIGGFFLFFFLQDDVWNHLSPPPPLFFLWPVPPVVSGQADVENVSVVVKSPVALSCEASGIPPPAVSWLKDGQPVQASGWLHVLSGPPLWHLHEGIFPFLTYLN